ncbi:unnamed protein product [Ilex paraguariensis]|uniref:Uncharacterized protein n=1 Tax=Ilex paraguariensis TaxID=185542 RepID=A0ABC8UC00_9AQUA
MITLSHWKIGNHLKGDDEVSVLVIVGGGCQMMESGIDLVWEQEENVGTPQMYKYNPKGDIDGDSDFLRCLAELYFLSSPVVNDSPSLVEEDMNSNESGTNGLQHPNGIRKVLVLSLALASDSSITFQRKRRTKSQ